MQKKILRAIIFIFLCLFVVNLPLSAATSLAGGELKAGGHIRLEGQRVLAEEEVSFSYQEFVFYGQSFSFDTSSQELVIERELRAVSGDYVLTGELLEGNLDQEVIDVFGGVLLEGPDVRAAGRSFGYRGSENELSLQEEVEFSYMELTATAGKLIYDIEKQLVLLQEGVSGSREGQEFTATRVEIDLQQDTIELQGEASIKFNGGE